MGYLFLTIALLVLTWYFCLRKGAYLMIDVFIMLGVWVTVLLCRIFFNEPISLWQCISFMLLILASFIMCSYSMNIKGNFTCKKPFTFDCLRFAKWPCGFFAKMVCI